MDEKQVMEQSVETKAMMAEMLRQHDRENNRLWCAVMALCVAVMIMAGCMLWAVQNAQNVANEAAAEAIASAQETMNEAVLSALEAVSDTEVTTTETTTTQTVEGDSATINNVDGEQYNDNASKGGVE